MTLTNKELESRLALIEAELTRLTEILRLHSLLIEHHLAKPGETR